MLRKETRTEQAARGVLAAIERGEVQPDPLELMVLAQMVAATGNDELVRELLAADLAAARKRGRSC